MKKLLLCLVGMASMLAAEAQEGSFFEPYRRTNLRLPSVPLIVNDPYFSIWCHIITYTTVLHAIGRGKGRALVACCELMEWSIGLWEKRGIDC